MQFLFLLFFIIIIVKFPNTASNEAVKPPEIELKHWKSFDLTNMQNSFGNVKKQTTTTAKSKGTSKATRRTSITTTKRSGLFQVSSTKKGSMTTKPRTTIKHRTQATRSTTLAKGVPQKLIQSATTRTTSRPTTRTTVWPRFSTVPVLPRALSFSMFGIQFAPPTSSFWPMTTTENANVTTILPLGSNATETIMLNATTNSAVEIREELTTTTSETDYNYEEEHAENSSTTVLSISTNETATTTPASHLSSMKPGMVRKRRKKTTPAGAITTTPSQGIHRIKVKRRKTTIAPMANE